MNYHFSEGLDSLTTMISNSPTPIGIDMERLLLSSCRIEIVQISEKDNIINAFYFYNMYLDNFLSNANIVYSFLISNLFSLIMKVVFRLNYNLFTQLSVVYKKAVAELFVRNSSLCRC